MPALNIENTKPYNQDIPPDILDSDQGPIIVLGIDIGTSGIRGAIVAKHKLGLSSTTADNLYREKLLYSESVPLEPPIIDVSQKSSTQNPTLWIEALNQLLIKMADNFDLASITDVVLDATSSTVLICDEAGTALSEALMYNDQQAILQSQQITQQQGFNPKSTATGASSTLAKVLLLLERYEQNLAENLIADSDLIRTSATLHICHQIDYLNHYLSGAIKTTDENNALKLGYDSINQAWPNWIKALLSQQSTQVTLPEVVVPGTKLGSLHPEIAGRYGFSAEAVLHAGTTDSIAGFLASGACQPGDAVISLGSTLAIKVIAETPIFDHNFGVYSHKLKSNWLVGGASNAGGAVLTADYTLPEMHALMHAIQRSQLKLTTLEQTAYYPLTKPGERFPIADSSLQPTMPAKPKQSLDISAPSIVHQHYFLGLIHGLIWIEQLAYEKLQSLGCSQLKQIYTVGGGVHNELWMALRSERFKNNGSSKLGYEMARPASLEAAFGVTRLIEP